MRISDVIPGDVHLNNVPRQINIITALNITPPKYAHLPMILGHDGMKLSKRHGAVNVREYRKQGFLPEALINYLVQPGWSHGDQEIFSIEEMISLFDIDDVDASASAFDPARLRWLNQRYIIGMPTEKRGVFLMPFLNDLGFDHAPKRSQMPFEIRLRPSRRWRRAQVTATEISTESIRRRQRSICGRSRMNN